MVPRLFGNYAGGQLVTLGAITGGSGYVDGTYSAVPLTGGMLQVSVAAQAP